MKNETEIHKDIKALIKIASKATHCAIQHNDCPCNTCFHSWGDSIGLSKNVGHLLWLSFLAIRGDYTEKDIKESLVDLVKDMK